MSYQQNPPQLGATFIPGGIDDYWLPEGPELVSPAPQRIMPEVPENMQDNIAHLELEANGPRGATSPMSPPAQNKNQVSPNFPPRSSSYNDQTPTNQSGHGQWPARQQSISSTFKQPPTVQPPTQQQSSHDYNQFANNADIPNFSIFPKLQNRPPNVPPSDDEKEAVLENARLPVLNSNDPEMQLAWAQDALAYVDAAQLHEQRLSELQPARPVTPQVEHQLRVDAMNVVSFLADQHHPKAEFMRGMWLEFGKFGLRGDKKEAFRCYTRAAQKGYARAEYRMGMQFEQSNDPMKALQHYKNGSDAGDSASNYRLGMMTLLGQHGQAQDYARGIQLITQAANTADENAPQGAYILGMLQARELPQINVPEMYLPYNEKAARQNIEKAAYLGFAKAQLKMGSAYELCTLGCDFSPPLSMHYNSLASRQGEAEADMAISKWFLCGSEGDFAKNEELAFQYAQRAATTGLATAQFAMGYFYEIGMHVDSNIQKALEWYEKAANSGNKDAPARIESINSSQTLSRKDHENVAISRIKSQHGSMRGQRPARFKQSQAPALPSVPDDSQLPDRGTTPYPLSDQPPQFKTSGPLDRPATTTPYPMDNGPPLGRQSGFAGGFAPELRSQSTAPPQRPVSSAFNINPNVYNDSGYGRGRVPSGGPGNGPLPLRPATSVDTMGQGRGRNPSGPRTPTGGSGGLPSGPGAYRQPGGPSVERPEQYPISSADIGYSAPQDGRNRLQKPVGPGIKKQATLPDIGYVAPLEAKQNRPSTVQPSHQDRPSGRLDRPSTAAPGPRPGPRPDSRPGSAGRLDSGPQAPPKSSTPQPSKLSAAQTSKPSKPAGGPAGGKPPGTPSKPPVSPALPGKGPKTFDEMGVGQAPADKDCIVM